MSIIQPVGLELIRGDGKLTPLPAVLVYRADDPYAVHLDVTNPDGSHEIWAFARELLADGISAVGIVGDGEVRVQRHPSGVITLHLTSPEGRADLAIDIEGIEALLSASYLMVPEGMESEHLGMEAELASLFGEAA